MSGWNTIQMVRRIENELDEFGMKLAKSKYTDWTNDHGSAAVVPKDNDSLPIYRRDAELFVGSIEAVDNWLKGLRWARDYDKMLKLSSDTTRSRKEQDFRNKQLVKILKEELSNEQTNL
jgi:hypothetical protein